MYFHITETKKKYLCTEWLLWCTLFCPYKITLICLISVDWDIDTVAYWEPTWSRPVGQQKKKRYFKKMKSSFKKKWWFDIHQNYKTSWQWALSTPYCLFFILYPSISNLLKKRTPQCWYFLINVMQWMFTGWNIYTACGPTSRLLQCSRSGYFYSSVWQQPQLNSRLSVF